MSERVTIAYEQVAREVEKLVMLFQESQENQQLFMSEAYRLLQAQAREVEDLREKAVTSEMIVQKLDQLMNVLQVIEVLLKQVHFSIHLPKFGGEPAEASELPGMQGGMQPGMQPSMQPSMQPGMQPGMLPGTAPGMMPGASPSMLPGTVPGMQPGMMPGTSPSMIPGTSPSMLQGGVGPMQTPTTTHFEQAPTQGRPGWNHESQVMPSVSLAGAESAYSASQSLANERAESAYSASQSLANERAESAYSASQPLANERAESAYSASQLLANERAESPAFASPSAVVSGSFADARSASTTESPAFASATVAVKESSVLPGSGSQPRPEVADPAPVHPAPHPPTANAQVRFIHASPDAPNVDILVDGKRLATGVAFQGVSPYLPLQAGRHRIQVFPAGVSHGAVVDTTVTLKPTQHYTVAVAGLLKNIRPIVIEDQPRHTKPGFARLKIVHLAQNAPAVDVTLPSGKVLIGHLTYKEKSPYLQVSPGTRDLELRPAGKQESLLKIPKISFAPNLTYTLYIFQDGTRLVPMLLPEA